jgi:hypothetical protein
MRGLSTGLPSISPTSTGVRPGTGAGVDGAGVEGAGVEPVAPSATGASRGERPADGVLVAPVASFAVPVVAPPVGAAPGPTGKPRF